MSDQAESTATREGTAYQTFLEEELWRCRTRAAQTERLGRIGAWELDLDDNALNWSEGTYRIFGLSPETPVTLQQAVSFYPEAARAELGAALAQAMETGETYELTVPAVTASGEERWIRSIGQLERDANGGRRLIGMVRDVTDEHVAAERLRHLAGHDPLTGLSNRRVLMERLESALHSVPGQEHRPELALLLVDVDRFKQINDQHGHDVGDALLVETARRLRSGVRGTDMVARLGGDEFALILYGVRDDGDMQRRLDTLLALFEAPAPLPCGPIRISLSVGAAVAGCHAASPAVLLKNADLAMYEAKHGGRGQGRVFHPGMGAAFDERATLLAEMRRALEDGELDVVYQPIIDLRTLAVRGMEALVRWHHPVRGLLLPPAFRAALDDAVLSVEIGRFVFSRSLRELRLWLDAGLAVACVNVNVTEAQLRLGEALLDEIATVLDAHALTADRLKVEVQESAFLGNESGTVFDTLARLQARGIMVALDDFGTGYASLSHLQRFRVSRIKIDRAFVERIGHDVSSTVIGRAIIELGRNLGIRVTAEGLVDLAQLRALVRTGCDCAQGQLFSRPLAASEVPGFFARWATDGPALIASAAGPG